MKKEQKYNIRVVNAALVLLEQPGMTLERLRSMREDEARSGLKDEVSEMYYDVLLTAIEIMTRPLFQ
jgi:hypothetical protein